jgi:hypothetical protein
LRSFPVNSEFRLLLSQLRLVDRCRDRAANCFALRLRDQALKLLSVILLSFNVGNDRVAFEVIVLMWDAKGSRA